MSNDVSLQADVGALTSQGLTALYPMLAALSADNVDPNGVLQMEKIGSLIRINGQYAERVPDLLKRCSSTRMDRFGVLLGWKRGDTASLMAQSTGGQAAALLCFCLRNLYTQEQAGSILFDLSEMILPMGSTISSIKHLGVVSDMLSAKLLPLGFGNILALHVNRILEVYKQLGKPVPVDFFDQMSRNGTVRLLHALFKAIFDPSCLVRISGTQFIGHITTLVLILFPSDVTLVVEGCIVHQGTRRSIIIESITRENNAPTLAQLEQQVQVLQTGAFPLEIRGDPELQRPLHYTFQWKGHVAEALNLAFMTAGRNCSSEFLDACASFVMLLASSITGHNTMSKQYNRLPGNRFVTLLGSEPTQRLYTVCKILLQAIPSGNPTDIEGAFSNLVATFKNAVGPDFLCTCPGQNICDLTTGWGRTLSSSPPNSVQTCLLRMLWRNVGNGIIRTLLCSLIDADESCAIQYNGNEVSGSKAESIDFVLRGNNCPELFWNSCQGIHTSVMALIKPNISRESLILSNVYGNNIPSGSLILSDGHSTIYPKALTKLQVDIDSGFLYELRAGGIVFKSHGYRTLLSEKVSERSEAEKSLYSPSTSVEPSSSGVHSEIFFTIREFNDWLELKTNMVVHGQLYHLDLQRIIVAAMGLQHARACDHSPRAGLDVHSNEDVITTSVITPLAKQDHLALVQTKNNRTAQMLACSTGARALLQKNCCLECAVTQAREQVFQQIIVGL